MASHGKFKFMNGAAQIERRSLRVNGPIIFSGTHEQADKWIAEMRELAGEWAMIVIKQQQNLQTQQVLIKPYDEDTQI